MDRVEYPEDSDSSDEDFDPGRASNEAVSEVDSDGDSEDPLSDKEDPGTRGAKRRRRNAKARKKRRAVVVDGKPAGDESADSITSPEKKELTEEEQKKKVDDLWASFKKDTNFKSKPLSPNRKSSTVEETKENRNNVSESKPEPKKDTVKVTQIFEFAGEEVKVEKEVATNSKEAKVFGKAPSGSKSGGLGALVGQLGKKQKITTLEKSKLDWDKFKKDENLEAELQTFNKGKDGYLEKQDFLQRTDQRRFEIERDIRTIERNKRMNMNNIN